MNSRPVSFLFAAALILGGLPAIGQEDRKPAPPTPPERPPERPEGFQPGRGGPREGRGEFRREGQPGPEEGRRPEDGPRREGERGPGGGPGRERMFNVPMPPPAPPVPTPYIGVVTLPPPAVLSAQLGLKEGFGLVVGDVLPDSPAAKAGVQKHDVLTKFNDQQLVDAGQFSTLVRAAGKDAEATLTIVRQAKEQKVPVKIGERMAPQRMPFPTANDLHGEIERWRGPAQEGMKKLQDKMKEYGEKMREYQERLKGWQKNPSGDMPQPPPPPVFEPGHAEIQIDPADILVEAQPGGVRRLRILQPNGAVSYSTADVKMLMKDDGGEIEVSSKDGQRVLVAKNPKGEIIFDGPIDTEEQRKKLPEDIRRKLDSIQVRTMVSTSAFEAPPLLPPGVDNVQ